MRTIVIGDIHGCIEEFKKLLDAVNYKGPAHGDRLILAGDLVDRGPDTGAVVRLARELKAEAVMGNHDEKHVRFKRHEDKKLANPLYNNPMRYNAKRLAEYMSLDAEDLNWLARLPALIRVEDCDMPTVVVHAGAEPGIPIAVQDKNILLRMRYLRKEDGRMASLQQLEKGTIDDFVFWADAWKGPERIVYGHNVVTDVIFHSHAIGIDTGCVFGGKLTALILSKAGPMTVSVKAREEYVPYKGWLE